MTPDVTSLDDLLRHNDSRMAAFRNHPLFALVRDEKTLASDGKRNQLLACIQRFSETFQTLLFIRQGACTDPRFQRAFLRHLSEEIGHDALLAQRRDATAVQDTLFEAISAWFAYQMFVLDNAERTALMHLVLENAGDYFHGFAAPRLGQHVDSPYFDVHAELDAGHASIGTELLGDLDPKTYARLGAIVDAGWNMVDALFERCRQLVSTAT